MKFIIENYSDQTHTQPLYFHNIINKDYDHESVFYDPGMESVYDVLDKNNPDYYITDANMLTQDFVTYQKNENPKIKLLLNVSSLSAEEINALDKNLYDDNVYCPLFFTKTNQNKLPKLKNRRILQLSDAADINLSHVKNNLQYNMPKAFFILKSFTPKDTSPHHIISNIQKLAKDSDIILPETKLVSLYKNYDEIIFYGIEDYIPQSFFDCLYLGCKVYYISDNAEVHNLIKMLLKPNQSLNYYDNDRMIDFSELHSYVKEKHCGQNRVKSFLSQIPRE